MIPLFGTTIKDNAIIVETPMISQNNNPSLPINYEVPRDVIITAGYYCSEDMSNNYYIIREFFFF